MKLSKYKKIFPEQYSNFHTKVESDLRMNDPNFKSPVFFARCNNKEYFMVYELRKEEKGGKFKIKSDQSLTFYPKDFNFARLMLLIAIYSRYVNEKDKSLIYDLEIEQEEFIRHNIESELTSILSAEEDLLEMYPDKLDVIQKSILKLLSQGKSPYDLKKLVKI